MQSILFLFTLFMFFPGYAYAQGMDMRIAAVVNDDAISVSDLEDRVKLIMTSSGLPDRADIRERVTAQVLDNLIEEQIKLQEAARLDLEITQQEIDQGFATIAGQNNMSPDEFRGLLSRSGINIATMEQQIRSQVAWGKVVQSQVRPRVSVSESDVSAELERLSQNIGKREYLLAEIFLPTTNETESDVRDLANRLVGEIRSGRAPFFRLAQQFSKAPGAEQGGDLGWVSEGQLPVEVDEALSSMSADSLSGPIRSDEGYHIMFVREIRQISQETLPTAEDIRVALGTKRLDRAQKRYYRDLRAESFTEIRIDPRERR